MAERRGNGKKQRNLIMQGGIMTVTCLMVNACLLLRRIPLTVVWGDEGNGIYAASCGAFTLLWLLSAYGLSMVMSGLLKPRLKKGQQRSAVRIMRVAFLYALVTGTAFGALLFVGSDLISGYILPEPLAALSLRLLAPALLFMSLGSVLRGFFLGNGAGFPVMLSFLIEQAVTLAGGFVLVGIQKGYGIRIGALLQNESFAHSFAVMGFAGGITVGALIAFVFLLCIYFMSHRYYGKKSGKGKKESTPRLAALFLASLFPVILYGFAARGYVAIQQICFRLFMSDNMATGKITSQWGIYEGKYKIFTMLPVVLAAAMGLTLRNRIRVLCRRADWPRVRDLSGNALKAAMVIVMPLSVMIGTLAVPILDTFFAGQDTESASALLLYGFITSVFFSAACLLADILLGMEHRILVLLCGVGSLAVHVGALYVMLETLHLDIFGVLYADMIYGFCLMVSLGAVVRQKCGFRQSLLRSMVGPFAASLVMGVILYLLSMGLAAAMPAALLLPVLAAAGAVIYIIVLLLVRGVTERELRLAPGGKLILMAGKSLRML